MAEKLSVDYAEYFLKNNIAKEVKKDDVILMNYYIYILFSLRG